MSEISNLHEKISPDLLKEATQYTISIVDSVTGASGSQYEAQVKLVNPYSFDPTPFVPKDRIMDLPAFYTLAAEVIADAQERQGIVASERVKLVQEYQPEQFYAMGDEVIATRVLRRTPGMMDKKAKGRPNRRSSHSHEFRSPGNPNKIIVIESRPIDHKIEFSCWAKTSELANKRALWLEKLFVTHAWAFEVQGVERFYWEGRSADTLWKHGEQRLHQRPLAFFVRLREHEVSAYPVLKRIDFTISTT